MSRILTSLHGRRFGLSRTGVAVSPGGFAAGDQGRQVHYPSPAKIAFFDDFTGDVIADQWNLVEGTSSATSDAAVLSGGIGGIVRVTTGAAGTGYAADGTQLNQALQWQASNGGLAIEVRLSLSRITTAYCFIGFSEKLTLEAPVTLSGTTFTTNAVDAVGFMFDNAATVDTWRMVGVKGNVDAMTDTTSKFATDTAPVANVMATLRVEVDASGNAVFFYNGAPVGSLSNAIAIAPDVTPTLAFSTGGASSLTADLDYVHVSMDRV